METSLKSKATKVLSWQSPQKEGIDNESLRLAKINQLPKLLRQQVDEERRKKEEIEVTRREIVDTLAKKHKVKNYNIGTSYNYTVPPSPWAFAKLMLGNYCMAHSPC